MTLSFKKGQVMSFINNFAIERTLFAIGAKKINKSKHNRAIKPSKKRSAKR